MSEVSPGILWEHYSISLTASVQNSPTVDHKSIKKKKKKHNYV